MCAERHPGGLHRCDRGDLWPREATNDEKDATGFDHSRSSCSPGLRSRLAPIHTERIPYSCRGDVQRGGVRIRRSRVMTTKPRFPTILHPVDIESAERNLGKVRVSAVAHVEAAAALQEFAQS